jgi:hypothetical protein
MRCAKSSPPVRIIQGMSASAASTRSPGSRRLK